MAKYIITARKGIQYNVERFELQHVAARMVELEAAGWTVEHIERDDSDRREEFVRFGSDGQRVQYEDAADASEHMLRMQEGWC